MGQDEVKICGTCASWEPEAKPRYTSGRIRGDCKKMPSCFCCNEENQPAGAIGGGDFKSFAEFGCILWSPK